MCGGGTGARGRAIRRVALRVLLRRAPERDEGAVDVEEEEGALPGTGHGRTELAPFAAGIGAILPAIFEEVAEEVDEGTFSGEGNPLTSAASTMAHVVHHSEAHGIDAGIMRAAEGIARQAIGLGHGADGLHRVVELLGRKRDE